MKGNLNQNLTYCTFPNNLYQNVFSSTYIKQVVHMMFYNCSVYSAKIRKINCSQAVCKCRQTNIKRGKV